MKKVILMLFSVLLICTIVNAQYRINKTKYDYHAYRHQVGDPYSPSVAGFASFLIPGFGQMASGEIGRGAAFLGGCVGCFAIWALGDNNYYEEGGIMHGGPGLFYLGIFGLIGVDLISVVDAVRVAKVNDLAFRDKDKTGYTLQMSPYFGSFTNEKISVGLSFKVRF